MGPDLFDRSEGSLCEKMVKKGICMHTIGQLSVILPCYFL
jgi:hypothetical protein